jgi:hypothetical protein
MKRSKMGLILAAWLAAALFTGCDDPYARRRINMRLANMRDLAEDIERSEKRHAQRCVEAFETLEKWWRSDTRRFNERLPTVGDYVW